VKIQCGQCKKIYDVPVTVAQVTAWREGELIQRAMPNLTDDERELLLTQTCGTCFDEMFEDDGEYCESCGDERPCECDKQLDSEVAAF
jgi:hypothetical protein